MSSHTFFTLLFALFLLQASSVHGHMYLFYPPTFNASNNPHRTTAPDPYLNYPHNCCGRTDPFPCKGYLSLLGTPDGQPVASWPAGSTQNFSLTAGTAGVDSVVTGGNHFGGSCQVGFSIDNGTTWKVATSYEGNCPLRNGGKTPEGQTFDFKVPADIPVGDQLFAWTWINREQEFQMNCAAVSILPPANGSGSGSEGQPAIASPVLPTTLATSFVPASSATTTSTSSSASISSSPSACNSTCDDKPTPKYSFFRAARPTPNTCLTPRNTNSKSNPEPAPVAFNDRPFMLFADISNGCITSHTSAEVKFPAPGPDVMGGDGAYPLELPTPGDKCGY